MFTEPERPDPMAPPHGWVLQPIPCNRDQLWQTEAATSSWCHFQLEGSRGGRPAAKDLSHIHRSVPALLGRQAILNSRSEDANGGGDHTFALEWGVTVYNVSISGPGKSLTMTQGRSSQRCVLSEKSLETNSSRTTIFQFLSSSYKPDAAACSSYFDHCKRKWSGGTESASIFFELDTHGKVVQRGGGQFYAVLPVHGVHTKLKFNFQGPWLLSVDRQDMQSLSDNAWNACVLRQTSDLCCCIAEWIASSGNLSGYCLFPEMHVSTGTLCMDLLGQSVSLASLESFLRQSPVVPVVEGGRAGAAASETLFVRADEACWLPPAIVKSLPIYFAAQFCQGRKPFASAHLGSAAYLEIWKRVLRRPSTTALRAARVDFRQENDDDMIPLALTCMAALVTALEDEEAVLRDMNAGKDKEVESKEKSKGGKGSKGSSSNLKEIAEEENRVRWLPAVEHWPIFLSNRGTMGVTARNIVLPSEEFAELPSAISEIIQPALANAHKPTLHMGLEKALRENNMTTTNMARKCLAMAREANPDSVMGVDTALHALHTAWARLPELSDALINSAVTIFVWAQSKSRKLSHLLTTDASGKTKMVPSHTLSIGKSYISATPLEDLPVPLLFVSDKYINQQSSVTGYIRAKYTRYLILCGAHRGLSFGATKRPLKNNEVNELDIKFRGSNTSVPLSLPYKLGPITRKFAALVDVDITQEWKDIIMKAGKMIKSASAMALVISETFGDADLADEATPTTTPVAAKLLQGKAEDDDVEGLNPQQGSFRPVPSGSHPPVKARVYFLPPGQPGGKALARGDSMWCKFLASSRWVPAAAPLSDASAPATLVLRPCEVGLPGCLPNMPQIRLPPDVVTKLAAVTSMNWGTKKPAPPVEELEEIVQELHDAEKEGRGECDYKAYHAQMVSIWRALMNAFQEKRISPTEQKRIERAARLAPVVPIEDDETCALYSMDFLVDSSREGRRREDSLAAASLAAVNFVFDVAKAKDQGLKDLLRPPPHLTVKAGIAYVKYCNSTRPMVTAEVSTAFSYALWTVMSEQIRGVDTYAHRAMSVSEKKTCSNALSRAFPSGVCVFCQRGPGINGWPARWLPINGADGVLPVVMDEIPPTPSGVLKKTLLTMEHRYQPLGMFWTKGRSDDAAINRLIVECTNVARLSTFKLRIQTKGKKDSLEGATDRLAVVLNLLQLLSETPTNIIQKPVLNKYDSILIHFSTPRLTDPELIPSFAVWGGSARGEPERPLFIAGQPEDYHTDLEELVATTYGRPVHASTSKAFRLLCYLEDPSKFHKFFKRDFGSISDKNGNDDDSSPIRKALRESLAILEPPKAPSPVTVPDPGSPLPSPPVVAVAGGDRGAGRGGIDNRPAWMTDTTERIAETGPGAGRGMDNRPAWMIGDVSSGILSVPASALHGDSKDSVSAKYVQPPPIESSRPAPDGSKGSTGVVDGDEFEEGEVKEADTDEPQLLSTATVVGSVGRGAGRGMVNLPAWMTDGPVVASLEASSVKEDPDAAKGVVASYVQPVLPSKNNNPLGARFEAGDVIKNGNCKDGDTCGSDRSPVARLLSLDDPTLGKVVRGIAQSNHELAESIALAAEGGGTKGGDWERHTSGFGSSLLKKMGFKGRLGCNEDGIAAPVETKDSQTNSKGLGFQGSKQKKKGAGVDSSTPYGPPTKKAKH